MANNIMGMKALKNNAIRVYTGMIEVLPLDEEEQVIDVSALAPRLNMCYAIYNSTICFVFENEVFVVPYMRIIERSLLNEGFKREVFGVPFSDNLGYPKDEEVKWAAFLGRAAEARENDFIEDCISYCDEHHIGPIREEKLDRCFEMPERGVDVRGLNFERRYTPIIRQWSSREDIEANLGHFCTNNEKVVFVYRNGKTYVAKEDEVVNDLRTAGYIESELFVPFSNCEWIEDSDLRMYWKSLII